MFSCFYQSNCQIYKSKTSHSSVKSRSIPSRCKRRASENRKSRSKTPDTSDHADRSASDVDSRSKSSKVTVSDTSVEIYKVSSGGSRIFPLKVGVLTIILQIFAENCMKMKEFGRGGTSLAPPWICQW